MSEPYDPTAEDYVAALVAQGKAEDLMYAYSEHNQSCHYVWGILNHVVFDETDGGIDPEVRNFARNLLDDWSK